MSLELYGELLATSGISETAHRTQRHLTQDDEWCRIQNCRIQHTTPKSLCSATRRKRCRYTTSTEHTQKWLALLLQRSGKKP